MNEKVKYELFLVDLYNLYFLESDVDYLENAGEDEESQFYHQEIKQVFKYDTVTSGFFETAFLEKCDQLYECLEGYDSQFMSGLLERLLTNNHANENELSNSLRFYFICVNTGIVETREGENFAPTLFLKKEAFRKLMFGFLFSYECFYYTHRLLTQLVKGSFDLSDVLLHDIVTQLCSNYCTMFR